MGVNVPHIVGGVGEQDAEVAVWTAEGGSDRRVYKLHGEEYCCVMRCNRYYQGDRIKESELGRTCSMRGMGGNV
jgi:hypothetical protein